MLKGKQRCLLADRIIKRSVKNRNKYQELQWKSLKGTDADPTEKIASPI